MAYDLDNLRFGKVYVKRNSCQCRNNVDKIIPHGGRATTNSFIVEVSGDDFADIEHGGVWGGLR